MPMPPLHKIQTDLARFWIGQAKPDMPPPAFVDPQGCALYGELIQFGLYDLLLSVYPVCAKLLGEDDFSQLVHAYLRTYPPDNYNLNQSARRFPVYLLEHAARLLSRYPFLADLADYEWLELEIMEDSSTFVASPRRAISTAAEFEQLRPIVNPSLKIRHYAFAVPDLVDELITSGKISGKVEKRSMTLAGYRHPETFDCKFLELADASASIVQSTVKQASTYQPTYRELLLSVLPIAAKSTGTSGTETFVLEFLNHIDKLHEHKIFIGEVESTGGN